MRVKKNGVAYMKTCQEYAIGAKGDLERECLSVGLV